MLEDYHHELLCCTGCGFCRKPYHNLAWARKESDTPKGKLMLAYGLLVGELAEDDDMVRALQKCTLCKRCEQDCPSLIKIAEIIQEARRELDHLLPAHEQLVGNIAHSDNVFGEPPEPTDGDGPTVFFMGCLTAKEMKDAVVSLFDKLDMNVRIVSGCCSHPAEKIGRTVTPPVRKTLDGLSFDRLVTSCPGGMQALREYDPVHLCQFLARCSLPLQKTDTRYMYHDPAFLGRHAGVYDEPRSLIGQAGTLVEFSENRALARWCGGDIEFKTAFPDEADELAEKLVDEARRKDATIVTASPHCYRHLKEHGEVIDLLQLIDRHLP
jgi:Fe-S oxidoreductase